MSRPRALLVLFLTWLPLAVGYSLAIVSGSGASVTEAIRYAVGSMTIVGVLAVGVWWLSGRRPWPEVRGVASYLFHIAAGVVYSLVWYYATVAHQAILNGQPVGPAFAATIARQWLVWELLLGFAIYGALAAVCSTIRARDFAARQQVRVAEAQALAAQAQLTALQARLKPHFLFNALHSLSAMLEDSREAAAIALEKLGNVMRYVVDEADHEDVALADEWAFVRDYLDIEAIRLGDRLRVVAEIDAAALEERVPPFSLQPLVENAVRHGVGPRPGGGTVTVRIARQARALRLEVSDDGVGCAGVSATASGGLGLSSLRGRLHARDERSRVVVAAPEGGGFRVTVELPLDDREVARERAVSGTVAAASA